MKLRDPLPGWNTACFESGPRCPNNLTSAIERQAASSELSHPERELLLLTALREMTPIASRTLCLLLPPGEEQQQADLQTITVAHIKPAQ